MNYDQWLDLQDFCQLVDDCEDDTPKSMQRWQRESDAWDNMPAFDNDSEGDVRF